MGGIAGGENVRDDGIHLGGYFLRFSQMHLDK